MTIQMYSSKALALRAVKALGYTVRDSISSSGDWGYGSRVYYRKPDSAKNQFGAYVDVASVSKVTSNKWGVSTF